MRYVDLLLIVAALPFMVMGIYLLILTLFSHSSKAPGARGNGATTRFVILVPAHNEEKGIGATIASLDAVDYDRERFQILVVADNCTDQTADIARKCGVEVLERADSERRGKGFALQYGIDSLLACKAGEGKWDALVVIDADSEVEKDLLSVLSSRFEAGERAVQLAYLPKRRNSSAARIITEVAFSAFHLVRSNGRENLGLSCGLRGNGMAFEKQLLRETSHVAFSRTEDVEFGVQLGLRGIRVAFAGHTCVRGDMPERPAAVLQQRERWIGGRMEMATRFAPSLLKDAARNLSVMSADLAIDLLIPPLSVVVLTGMAGLLASTVSASLTGHLLPLLLWCTGLVCIGLHVSRAAWIIGRGRELIRCFTDIPSYALSKAGLLFRSFVKEDKRWIRTPREGEL